MRLPARKSFIFSLLAIIGVMGLISYMAPRQRAGLFPGGASLRPAAAQSKQVAPGDDAGLRTITSSYGRLPMQFEANEGQSDPRVKFISRGNGYSLFLTGNKAVLALRKTAAPVKKSGGLAAHHAPKTETRAVMQLSLAGANSNPHVAGENPLPGHANYFIGNDPSKWRTNVPTYSRVAYEGVYRGIDEAFYGNQRELEYDFDVAPGADAGQIAMRVDGAKSVSLQPDGSLRLAADGGAVELRTPVAYQMERGQRKLIAASYDLGTKNEIRFHLGGYDHSQPLVIDPALVYSTFLGGSSVDDILAGRIDSSGNFYVTGFTFSNDFPLAAAFQSTNNEFPNGNQIVFVSELTAAGNNLTFSTYLGGSGLCCNGATGDEGTGIALNPSNGNVVVAGGTFSSDFPVTSSAYQTLNGGAGIGAPTSFMTVLNAAGNGLVYSTYLGGNNGDEAFGVAADSAGIVYLGGVTASVNFPIVAGAPEPVFVSSQPEGYLSRIDTTKSGVTSLTYSTFIGGTGNANGDGDEVNGLRTDGSGNIFFGGLTSSSDFLTTAGIASAFQTTCVPCGSGGQGFNGFVGEANTNPGASGFTWLTFLGGSTADSVNHVANDAAGNVFVTGQAYSSDFPVSTGAFQTTLKNTQGLQNAFVTAFNAGGATLLYSTYLGGSGQTGAGDVGFGIAVDPSDNAYVTGQTGSTDFPLASPIQSTNNAPSDSTNVFITEMNPTGTGLIFSTYLGGSSNSNSSNFGDTGWGIAVDSSNAIYVAGTTGSPDFPLATAFQNGFGGFDDGFLTKISQASGTVTVSPSPIVIYSTAVGTSAPSATSTLTNGTSSAITLTSLTISGTNAADFVLDGSSTCTAGSSVGASTGTCTIIVDYTPTSASAETAQLSIVFNGQDSPVVVPLMGAIGSYTISVSPGSLNLTAGQSGTSTLTVTPGTSGFSGTITVACSGAPSGASCSVSPGTITDSGTATITVTTTARSNLVPAPPSAPSRPQPWLPVTSLALAAALGIGLLYTKRLPSFGRSTDARAGVIALIAMLLLIGGMTACSSSSSGSGGTPAGSYPLTVTATAGNLAPTTTLTLNVQ